MNFAAAALKPPRPTGYERGKVVTPIGGTADQGDKLGTDARQIARNRQDRRRLRSEMFTTCCRGSLLQRLFIPAFLRVLFAAGPLLCALPFCTPSCHKKCPQMPVGRLAQR